MRKRRRNRRQKRVGSQHRWSKCSRGANKGRSLLDSHLALETLEMRTLLAVLPAVSITDATLLETDAASVQAQFSVQLTSAPTSLATIQIDTVDGTATATSGDYAAVAGLILSFGPSLPLLQTVSIDVFGD